MKHILITGANSYIGTSVEKYLSQWPEAYHVDTIDMVDGSWRERSFAGYDSVFHVAGIAHMSTRNLEESDRKKYWYVNAELPVEVAQKAKDDGAKQFIFLSSMSVFGEEGSLFSPMIVTKQTLVNPKDIYGKSKVQAEVGLAPLHDEGFRVCVLRPPMIYGPNCKGNYQLLSKISRKTPVFPALHNQRSMLFIGNLCGFIQKCVDEERFGLFLPQNGQYVDTSEMVRKISAFHGRSIWFTRLFNPLLRLLNIGVMRKVFGSLVIDVEPNDICDIYDFSSSIVMTEGSNTR